MTKPIQRARKRKPQSELRIHYIKIALTQSEAGILCDAANLERLPVSVWLRSVALKAAGRRKQ